MSTKIFCFKRKAELRDWLMSAADEWAGEGVTSSVLRTSSPKGEDSALKVFCPMGRRAELISDRIEEGEKQTCQFTRRVETS